MSLKVLHILDHSVPLHSGYAFRTLSLLHEQRRLGWETVHLTSTKHYGATNDVEDVDGYRFYRTRVKAGGVRALPVLDQLAVIRDTERRLDEVVAIEKPDLLHAHSPCLNGIAAIRVARRRNLPVVYEMRASWEDAAVDHGSTTEGSLRYRISRGLETWVLKRVDAITTICQGLRQDILARGIADERVTVIPNGVNIEEFPGIRNVDFELKKQLGLEQCFVLGFLGSFYGYEGLEILIAAMNEILSFSPNARVLLVGGGREETVLRKQIATLGLQDKVILVGRVPHSEVARYYSVVDLLVYPRKSIRLTETVTPLKPLEAMAQERLLLASNVGGHRELIRDGETGYLFAPDDPKALAQGVRRVLSDQNRWSTILRQGRHFVETERNWRISASNYPGVYGRAQHSASAR
jgi:PEP-CTERM/exosortase A-associated glycosyltransferase